MIPIARKSWWCWLAKEEKRQPRAATRPPMTAVSRVDRRRHTATVTGDASSDTHAHSEHSHTAKEELLNAREAFTCDSCKHSELF